MPSIRVGYGSDFVVKNQRVGIGTDDPRATLDVRGNIRGNFEISGVTTLTSYAGFIPQKQNIATKSTTVGFATVGLQTVGVSTGYSYYETETGYESLVGEYNTLSDDLIVDDGKIFEIKTTSITGVTTIGTQSYDYDTSRVDLGTLESVSIQSHFTLPNGGIETRPENPIEGTVRFNDDLNTLEFYNGVEWRQFTVTGASGRALHAGGQSPATEQLIEYTTISSLGNAKNFGDLTTAKHGQRGGSSSTRGLYGGEGPSAGVTTDIEYVTIASEGNAIDFDDLTVARRNPVTCASSTRCVFNGGVPSTTTSDYVEIATIGQAITFGTLTNGVEYGAGCASPTRGVMTSSTGNRLYSFITISSGGSGNNFGDLTRRAQSQAGLSNSLRGIFAGGAQPASPGSLIDDIEYITISSEGNGIEFGNLTQGKTSLEACASQTRGLIVGGNGGGVITDEIDYVTIHTTGNAQDFGDLSIARGWAASLSDSHGGLGGF